MTESWKLITEFPDYEVSDCGRVRSWKSKNGKGKAKESHLLKTLPFADKPYLRVSLYEDGKPHIKRVHRLVLEAFVGPCPEGLEGCHGDGNPANNSIENLRWGTKEENAQDRIDHGRQARGERVSISVLTGEQAREIRARVESGEWKHGDGRVFSRKFGVSDCAVSGVKNNQTWNHV